jgi:hypothetical protein
MKSENEKVEEWRMSLAAGRDVPKQPLPGVPGQGNTPPLPFPVTRNLVDFHGATERKIYDIFESTVIRFISPSLNPQSALRPRSIPIVCCRAHSIVPWPIPGRLMNPLVER